MAGEGPTTEGRTHVLDVAFSGATQITTWYIGLIDGGGTLTFAATDTAASHVWSEYTTYDEATRNSWGEGGASSNSITNATAEDFTISSGGAGSIHGIFLQSTSTKSDASGVLMATAAFSAAQTVSPGDVLKVTLTITMA